MCALLGFNCCAKASGGDYENMNVQQFAKFIEGKQVQLLDVRTPEEYAQGHIAGAANIDVFNRDFIRLAEKDLDKSKPVAVYCRSGKRSADAARQLAAKGFKVVNLEGGIMAWAQSQPVTR